MTPYFSIVMPLYNKQDYLTKTLESVFKQTCENFEIIVVNDGSTDKSLEKVSRINDSRIKLILQDNQGAAAARNTGIKEANGDYVVFLDADDIWLTNHLEELKKLQIDFPNCGMYCSRYKTKISKNKSIENSFSYSIEDSFRGIIPDFFEASLINRVAFTSSLMIPKKILDKYGTFDTDISSGQDLDLWIRIAAYENVAVSNKITAIYRFEIPSSLSKTSFLDKKIIDFEKFRTLEDSNKSLKRFLDIYRLEYAIQYRIGRNISKSKALLKEIKSVIPLKTKILLKLPPRILQILLKVKHAFKKIGFDFSIYH